MNSNDIRIGTTGFSHKDWLGNFYPQFCPPADFLRIYVSQFNSVEIDSTFHCQPTEETVKKWANCTPDDFIFTARCPKTVTHEGDIETRLKAATDFIRLMSLLKLKLGPLLLTFPYSFKSDQFSLIKEFFDGFPTGCSLAVEVCHQSWYSDDRLVQLLADKNIALALIDHPCMPRKKIETADFHYLRFLGDRKKIIDEFSYVRVDRTDDLSWWVDLTVEACLSGRKIFGFFDNHYSGHSPSTANLMVKLLAEKLAKNKL